MPLNVSKLARIEPAIETDYAMPLMVSKAIEVVYDIIGGGTVQLAGSIHGTSSVTGALTVHATQGATASIETKVIERSSHVTGGGTITSAGEVVDGMLRELPPSVFTWRRKLSNAELGLLAILATGASPIAVIEHNASPTQAVAVAVVVYLIVGALISRGPDFFEVR